MLGEVQGVERRWSGEAKLGVALEGGIGEACVMQVAHRH